MSKPESKNKWLGIADGKLVKIDENENAVLQAIPKGAKDILLIRGIIIDPGLHYVEAPVVEKPNS